MTFLPLKTVFFPNPNLDGSYTEKFWREKYKKPIIIKTIKQLKKEYGEWKPCK